MGEGARVLLAFVTGAVLGACSAAGAFACESDEQCMDGPHRGRCEPSGWCSFPSAECDSGFQYAPHAGDGLAGACVDAPGAATEPGSGTQGPGEGTTADADDGSTTLALDDGTTTADPTGPGTTSGPPPTTSGSTETGEPVDPAVFHDDFSRPDDPALRNGWIEKTPTAFQIVDGRVVFESAALGYEDNLWYRDESLLDVQVCVDVQLLAVDGDTHPQVHARIQPEDVEAPGSVTAYIL